MVLAGMNGQARHAEGEARLERQFLKPVQESMVGQGQSTGLAASPSPAFDLRGGLSQL
jgi:hypothetical protein